MSNPLLRLGQYLLILAMFAACGGHWLVLQSVAWGGMIVEYSQGAKFTVALEKTFDGQHPCGLCRQIGAGKQKEQKQESGIVVAKWEFYQAAVSELVAPRGKVLVEMVADTRSAARAERPPVPPPRVG